MKLIGHKEENFWDKKITLELTTEEFAIILSCLLVTPPCDVVEMSNRHLGKEVPTSKLSDKLYDMTKEGTKLFKNL